ncbi:hypothetical protein ACIFOE_20980 [Paenibacillus sp. NRS-1783]|uniref:hypothetical protein n=1 Tax=Paenibacillus sp. NRS-1783 TaxID=3233907 RepID=UPI003D2E7AC8
MSWKQKLKSGGYDVVAPDGAVWEYAFGEWTSKSFPGASYDTKDLAEKFEDME